MTNSILCPLIKDSKEWNLKYKNQENNILKPCHKIIDFNFLWVSFKEKNIQHETSLSKFMETWSIKSFCKIPEIKTSQCWEIFLKKKQIEQRSVNWNNSCKECYQKTKNSRKSIYCSRKTSVTSKNCNR